TTNADTVSTSDATVVGNISHEGDSSLSERGICLSTSQNPTTADKIVEGSAVTGNFSVSSSGLIPGQTYYARAYAVNSNGLTGYGSVMQFTMPMNPPGNALNFDGSDDAVSFSNSTSFQSVTNALTVEAWISVDSFSNSVIFIATGRYSIQIKSSGQIEAWPKIGGSWENAVSSDSVGTGEWHHVAFTYDGDVIAFYIDGIAAGTDDIADGSITADNIGSLSAGAHYFNSSQYFDGKTDELRIWNTARSQADIQSTMHTELTGGESGLVAYYNFNHISGTTLADLTANGNHGTLHNGPSYEVSGAIVGDIDTAYQNDIHAIWDTATDAATATGLSLGNASGGGHLVFGHDNTSGTDTADAPAGEEAGFQRLSRIWQTDVSGTASADMTFDLGDAGGSSFTGPDTHGLIRYVLLRRAGDTGDFEVVKTADSIPDDQIVFSSVSAGDFYHTLGLRADSAPTVANAVSNVTVNEDAGPTTINIASVFADIDNDDTAILESVVSDSNPSLVSAGIAGNTLTLTFGPDRNGTAAVVIRGTSNGRTADDSFTVTVNPVDDPLYVADALPDVTADEDAADTVTDLGSLFGDIDSPVIVKTVLSDSSPSLISASITGDTLTLDYLENQHGAAEIVIRGTADGATADDTFTVTVNPVDDAPSVAGEIGDVTADEDAPPVTVNLDGVFTDVDNDDTAIVKTVLSDDNPSLVSATVAGDTLTLEFQENQNGTAMITVQASSGGRVTEDTFTVTVNPVDDPLTVISGIQDVAADEDAAPAAINLGGVFGDIDSDISAITKSLLLNDSPSLVSATVTGDILTLEYQADQSGTAAIIVQGNSDGQTAEDTFTVTVSPVDDPP
ncbi:MAG: hypothetical protein DRI57_32965, partial [Deltaproteobacteria bacterium]